MNFRKLSEAFFNGSSDIRHSSSIEYKTLSGAKIAPGITSQQMTFTAKGNGVLEFFRRGSFMERGSAFPGLWKTQCDATDLEAAWKKLGDLGPHSFPARVADPGDTISVLSAYVSGQVETLTWGPPDPNVRAPGQEFLIALAPLMNLAAEGEITWAVEMAFSATRPTTGGISISLTFPKSWKNPHRHLFFLRRTERRLYLKICLGPGRSSRRNSIARRMDPGKVGHTGTRFRVAYKPHPRESGFLVASSGCST